MSDVSMGPALELDHQHFIFAEWRFFSPQLPSLLAVFKTKVQHRVFVGVKIEIMEKFEVPDLNHFPGVLVSGCSS
jgi:hypothetical protein